MPDMVLPAPSKSGILPGTKCPPAPPAERMWRLAGSNADGMACPLAGITDMPAHKAARRFGAHAVAVSGILAHAPRGHNEPAGHTIRQRKCRNCRAKTSGRRHIWTTLDLRVRAARARPYGGTATRGCAGVVRTRRPMSRPRLSARDATGVAARGLSRTGYMKRVVKSGI